MWNSPEYFLITMDNTPYPDERDKCPGGFLLRTSRNGFILKKVKAVGWYGRAPFLCTFSLLPKHHFLMNPIFYCCYGSSASMSFFMARNCASAIPTGVSLVMQIPCQYAPFLRLNITTLDCVPEIRILSGTPHSAA